MKKGIFWLLLICLSYPALSQSIDSKWGAWVQVSCFKGLFVRMQYDHYNKNNNQHAYLIEIQNRYSRKVKFTYFLYNPATEQPKTVNPGYTFGDESPTLKPGDIHRRQQFVIGNGGPLVQIFDVCFQFRSDGQSSCTAVAVKGNGAFAECDNGTPNYKIYSYTEEDKPSTGNINVNDSKYETVRLGTAQNNNYTPAQNSTNNNYTPAPQQTKGQKQAETLNILTNTIKDLATAIAKSKPTANDANTEVTEKDFVMYSTPYNPADAKEQATRFVTGFTKRPGVSTTPSGVYYQVLTAGTGVKPTVTDNVRINFRKTTVVGRQYKDVLVSDKGETINISDIGPKLAEGIRLMNAGSKYCFVFPANLSGSHPEYPEGSVSIVWVIDLLEVVR